MGVLQSEEYLVCDMKSLLLQLQGLVMTLCKVPWKFHLYLNQLHRFCELIFFCYRNQSIFYN